jgi:hypothetical protein
MMTNDDPFAVKANLAVVVRGDMRDLSAFAERVELLASELQLVIVHKQASASRLWIKEADVYA